ncbi:BglG family transcription antiterminator [Candidatus Enterococcus willemsii]|uniref:Uncharacterized protein n=1 Tax=Candidatus Enterococcus willemsii TaxID=1857215 RepID=A0ABQ6Z1R7_9ENTE|nr:BglG family transcription antiterminator [Enterococcus sp. CU12B]KAF1305139.1 hypothetical protein BAU17_05010 [Enterococcus sp. CU12B]
MFDQKSKQITEKLIETPKVEINSLAHSLGMSKTQIEYNVEKINQQLTSSKQIPIYFDGNILTLEKVTKEFFLEVLLSDEVYKHYELNPMERRKYIYLMMIYHKEEYLSVNHFLDALKISKTTFMNDLKQVENEINGGIKIQYTRKKGYYLVGNEGDIRYQLIKMIIQDFTNSQNIFLYDYFIHYEKLTDKNQIESFLRECMQYFDIQLVENRFQELVYMLAFLIPRFSQNWDEFYNQYNFQTFFLMKEYKFAETLLQKFGIVNEHSYLYLSGWILGMSIGNYHQKNVDFSIINELVQRIVQRFESLSGIRFKNHEQVIEQLFSHLRPTYYRLFFKLPIVNMLNKKIQTEYSHLYRIVEETMKPISELFGYMIPEEEISFLTVHFASLIENFDEYKVQRKVGVIVCPNGIGSSAIIYNELKNIFPEMILIGPVENERLENDSLKFDLIFTTFRNIKLYKFKKPIYVVTPIMSIEERYKLRNEVNNSLVQSVLPNNPVELKKQLLSVIYQYGTVYEPQLLETAIEQILLNNEGGDFSLEPPVKTISMNKELRLTDFMKPQYIQMNVTVRSWEEALYIAGTPLLDAGIITRGYIEKIIQNVYEEGPYMIIMKDVALPHAHPSEGVLETGIGMTVLSSPIEIASDKTIKYIFTLAAKDQKQHLGAISDLVSLLENDDFFQYLDNEIDEKNVFQWLRKHNV